jgi:hypothetical protein
MSTLEQLRELLIGNTTEVLQAPILTLLFLYAQKVWAVGNPYSSYEYLLVDHGYFVHPGSSTYGDAVMAWNSTLEGTIYITATISDGDPGSGDGINYKILKNSEQLYNNDFANGFSSTDIPVSTNVSVGDMLYFRVNMRTTNGADSTNERIKIYQSMIGENQTKVVDVSKYGHNGTLTNAIWTSSGKYGGAYNFDGSGDYITKDQAYFRVSGFFIITISMWLETNKDSASWSFSFPA